MPRFGPKNAKEEEIFAIENFRADLQQVIFATMERKKISRKELARRLGCSQANVTQLLSEDANPRIESVARIFHALGDEAQISSSVFDDIRSQEAVRSYLEALGQTLAERRGRVFEKYSTWLEDVTPVARESARAANTSYRQQGRCSAEHVMRTLRGTYEDPRQRSMAISNHNEISFEVSTNASKAA